MISDILSNVNFNLLNFAIPKNIILNSTHYLILKIPNKRELQKNVFNHLSDIESKDFMNFYKKCTAKPCYFLIIYCNFASDNPLHFRKNFLEKNIKTNHDN